MDSGLFKAPHLFMILGLCEPLCLSERVQSIIGSTWIIGCHFLLLARMYLLVYLFYLYLLYNIGV